MRETILTRRNLAKFSEPTLAEEGWSLSQRRKAARPIWRGSWMGSPYIGLFMEHPQLLLLLLVLKEEKGEVEPEPEESGA